MRRDQVLWDEEPQRTTTALIPAWVPNVYRIFTKVFDAKPFTLEQEKRIKVMLGRAPSEDAAFEAIDLMFQEGVVYPNGRDVREAIERVGMKYAMREWADPGSGPWISFRDWYRLQDDDMKARVKRVFPSLRIYAEENDA